MAYDIDYKERMLGYYPPVIRGVRDFKAIIDSESPEIENLDIAKTNVLDNAYLSTMDEHRIKQWESVLGIVPVKDSTIEDRRDVILARFRGHGKLNTALIQSIVNTFTGGSATAYISNSVLWITITAPPNNKDYKFANVEQELRRKVPAHLGIVIKRNYGEWDNYDDSTTWNDMIPDMANETWEDVLLKVDTN